MQAFVMPIPSAASALKMASNEKVVAGSLSSMAPIWVAIIATAAKIPTVVVFQLDILNLF